MAPLNAMNEGNVSTLKRAQVSDRTDDFPAAKRAKTGTKKVASQPTVLSKAPNEILDVYVFGANQQGELGLGRAAGNKHVRRPRLNPNLSAKGVGVVAIAVGGMHTAVLTHDNKILTWGVNDNGALGRDTTWSGGMKDVNDEANDSEDEDDEVAINPTEAMPTQIDTSQVPSGTVFTQIVATDNATFALTQSGLVFGWGTFRDNEGPFGFAPGIRIQRKPSLVRELSTVTKLAAGSNHVLALTSKGAVHAWGCGDQGQLGRRMMRRIKETSLRPYNALFRSGITDIGCGSDHSFAINKSKGLLYSWGLNNYGQAGIAAGAGKDGGFISSPKVVTLSENLALKPSEIFCIGGGNHHSVTVDSNGTCWTWGRIDNKALGHETTQLMPHLLIHDAHDRARILKKPQPLLVLTDVVCAAAASDHCVAITAEGKAYSWGFSSEYQTGLGTEKDVESPTLIDNTATRGKQLCWAGAGGQFSVIAGVAELPEEDTTNGVTPEEISSVTVTFGMTAQLAAMTTSSFKP